MSGIENAIKKAIEADNNFEKVLNDVARGYAACGFFEIENWQQILQSSFNANVVGSSSRVKEDKKKLAKQPQAEEDVSSVTLKPQKLTMGNKLSSPRPVTRRSTVTLEKEAYTTSTTIVQPKKVKVQREIVNGAVHTELIAKERKKPLKGLAGNNTSDPNTLSSRTLRSGAKQIFEA